MIVLLLKYDMEHLRLIISKFAEAKKNKDALSISRNLRNVLCLLLPEKDCGVTAGLNSLLGQVSLLLVFSMPRLTKTFISWSRNKVLYMADCSKQVGTEQQDKSGILPGLLSTSNILELQTWKEKQSR